MPGNTGWNDWMASFASKVFLKDSRAHHDNGKGDALLADDRALKLVHRPSPSAGSGRGRASRARECGRSCRG